MTANRAAGLFHRLRSDRDGSDAELLGRFAAARDAAAFATLVHRHGPLVFGVCRRTLAHSHDAEDAFQAVFLVLAQKASRLRDARLLSAWLYGVALRVAKKAKRRAARRREELRAVPPDQPTTGEPVSDLGPVLDEELAALPTWYREAVLACDVEQLSRSDAAAKLGIPEGTLSSRLAAGRKRLAERLARRGVTLAVPLLLAVVVPPALAQRTAELVSDWAAGGAVAKPIAELAHGGSTMLRTLVVAGTSLLAATAVGVGLAQETPKPKEKKPEPKAAEVKVDERQAAAVVVYGTPKMKKSVAVSVHRAESLDWTPDGNWIVLSGFGAYSIPPKQDSRVGIQYRSTQGAFYFPESLPLKRHRKGGRVSANYNPLQPSGREVGQDDRRRPIRRRTLRHTWAD